MCPRTMKHTHRTCFSLQEVRHRAGFLQIGAHRIERRLVVRGLWHGCSLEEGGAARVEDTTDGAL